MCIHTYVHVDRTGICLLAFVPAVCALLVHCPYAWPGPCINPICSITPCGASVPVYCPYVHMYCMNLYINSTLHTINNLRSLIESRSIVYSRLYTICIFVYVKCMCMCVYSSTQICTYVQYIRNAVITCY